jgi:hypothetical protein
MSSLSGTGSVVCATLSVASPLTYVLMSCVCCCALHCAAHPHVQALDMASPRSAQARSQFLKESATLVSRVKTEVAAKLTATSDNQLKLKLNWVHGFRKEYDALRSLALQKEQEVAALIRQAKFLRNGNDLYSEVKGDQEDVWLCLFVCLFACLLFVCLFFVVLMDSRCFGVVWCGVVWCGVVWCGVVWCGVVWCAAQNRA